MKFCRYCGAQLEDNQVCTCQQAAQTTPQPVSTPEPAPAVQQPAPQPIQQPVYQQPPVQQPVYQQPPVQQPVYQQPNQPMYQQPMYAQPVYRPVKIKQGPNVFEKTLASIGAFFKSPLNAAKTAVASREYGVAGLFFGVQYVSLLLFYLFMALKMKDTVSEASWGLISADINVLMIFLLPLLTIVLSAALYMVTTSVMRIIFAKDVPGSVAFSQAFIEYAIYSLPITLFALFAGLTAFIHITVATIIFSLLCLSFIFLIISVIADKVKDISENFGKIGLTIVFMSTFIISGHYLFNEMMTWLFS